MGEVIPFPLRQPRAETELALDLPFLCGTMLGIHLTEWNDVAVFVQHNDDAVGGLLTLRQAVELRSALTTMLDRAFGLGWPDGAA